MPLALFLLLLAAACEAAERPRNVVLFVFDGARADQMSAYSPSASATPGFDALSRRGVLFLSHFSAGTNTQTSVPRLLSSRRYSVQLLSSIRRSWEGRMETPQGVMLRRDPEQVFLPEALRAAGYRAVLLTDHPLLGQGKSPFMRLFDEVRYWRYHNSQEKDVVDALLAALAEPAKERRFFYVHILSPHLPERLSRRARPAETFSSSDMLGMSLKLQGISRLSSGWSAQEIGAAQAAYRRGLKAVDIQLARLDAALRTPALAAGTLLAVTADHGESLGESPVIGRGGSPRDVTTRVPLAIIAPGLPAGARAPGLTEGVDVMPTILELCGVPVPYGKSLDGRSLLGPLRRGTGKRAVVWPDALRTDDWLWHLSGPALFRLSSDPFQVRNVAAQHPGKAGDLKALHSISTGRARRRYESSARREPVDFSFAYAPHNFELTPEAAVARGAMPTLEAAFGAKAGRPWLLNVHLAYGLFFRGGNDSEHSLRLSAAVPPGRYRVSVQLVGADGPVNAATLRFGLSEMAPPRTLPSAARTSPLGAWALEQFDLGEVSAPDGRFMLRLSAARGSRPFALRSIRFEPAGRQHSALDQTLKDEGYW